MFDLITCPHCEYVAHISGLIGPTADDCPRCGKRALYSVPQLLREAEQLREALYMALPFVEDHEGNPAYKPQAVAQAVARIRKALGEPELSNALNAARARVVDKLAADIDAVILQTTGEPKP